MKVTELSWVEWGGEDRLGAFPEERDAEDVHAFGIEVVDGKVGRVNVIFAVDSGKDVGIVFGTGF